MALTSHQKKHCQHIAKGLIHGTPAAKRKFHNLVSHNCHEAVEYIKRCCRQMGNTNDNLFAGIPQTASRALDIALTPVRWAANTAGKTVHYAGSLLQSIAHKI